MKNNKRYWILLGLAPFALSGCAALAVTSGAAVGVKATQEGGLSRALSDAQIQAAINDLWFRHDVKMFAKLDLTVSQGRVLITGVVQDPEHRVEAVRLAWQPQGVQQVINEIRVADSEGVVGFAKDTWISTRLRTAITFDGNIQSINYNIDTVQGVVYLMGYAQSQKELDRVMHLARTIPNVKQVVSYVTLVGSQPSRTGTQASSPQPASQAGSVGSDYQGAGSPVPLTPQEGGSTGTVTDEWGTTRMPGPGGGLAVPPAVQAEPL